MKFIARILSVAVLASLALFYIACGPEGGDPESEIDQQIEKLNGTWNVTTATLDGVAPPVDQSGFVLTINGTKGNTTINFTATRPGSLSPWPPSGTFDFDAAAPSSKLIRNDGGGETVPVDYSVSGSTLVMDFVFDGDPFPSGRAKNVTGSWHYEFTKQP